MPATDVDERGLRNRCRDDHPIAWLQRGSWREDYRGVCSDGHWWEQTRGRALTSAREPGGGLIELKLTFPVGARDRESEVEGRVSSSPFGLVGWSVRFVCGLGHTSALRSDHAYDWRTDVDIVRETMFPNLGRAAVDSARTLRQVMIGLELKGWQFAESRVDCPRCVAERDRFAREREARFAT